MTREGDAIRTDMTLDLGVRALFHDVRYLLEEIAEFRAGAPTLVAINGRTVVDGTPRRQQWDVFHPGPNGLEGYRVQAKSLESFRIRHPGFVARWDPSAFGQPWLADYDAAPPDRRPDLDPPGGRAGLKPSFALALYWTRFLPPEGAVIPVFLPGFKHDARVDVAFGPAIPAEGGRRWEVTLRHPKLSARTPSRASVTVSPAGDLLTLSFELHAPLGSARGALRTDGCEGAPVAPDRRH